MKSYTFNELCVKSNFEELEKATLAILNKFGKGNDVSLPDNWIIVNNVKVVKSLEKRPRLHDNKYTNLRLRELDAKLRKLLVLSKMLPSSKGESIEILEEQSRKDFRFVRGKLGNPAVDLIKNLSEQNEFFSGLADKLVNSDLNSTAKYLFTSLSEGKDKDLMCYNQRSILKSLVDSISATSINVETDIIMKSVNQMMQSKSRMISKSSNVNPDDVVKANQVFTQRDIVKDLCL